MANSFLRGHPSAMTADQYYDAESKKNVSEQTDEVLRYNSVPFYERPLDSDESDRIVGKDEAGNFIRQTILGNRYTVSLNPDQRTTRTKIEEDVIPAVKKFADDPRFPTMDEVVGAGTAVAKGAYETASIPIDLLTSKRSPTSVQMGDAFDIAGGAAVGAGLQILPDNAMGMFIGRKSAEIREGNSEPIFINEWKKLHGESPRTEEWESGVDSPHVVAEVNYDINNFPETLKELEKVGWFKGRDGKLRREISDEPASFNPSALVSLTSEEIRKVRFGGSKDNLSTLGDTLKHDNFFEQYPEFKDVPIIVDKSLKGTNTEGYFLPGSTIIAINPKVLADPKQLKALVLHEVMHLVQNKEKFSGGTNDESQDVVKFYDYEKNKPEAKAAWSKYENSLTELRKTFYSAALKKNKALFEFMLQRTARDEGVPIEKLRAAVKEDSKIIQAGQGGRSAIHDLANKEFQDWMDAGRPKRPLVKYPTEFPSVSWANNLSSINNFLINKKPNGLDAEVEFAKDSMRETNSIISTIYSDEDVKLFKKITGKSPIKKFADMTSDRFEGKDIIHSYADFIGLKDKPPERPLYVNPNEKFNDQKNTLFMLYQRNMGETEARNVSSRINYTQEEIDAGSITKYDMDDSGFTNRQTEYIKPFNTEDIPADMQWDEKEFNKGGTAMKDQMEINFALGGVAETVDPVSGNDVPPGSLPVEVRDDIPARLSEGEYVVPADVVRFFGVKYFEDLRAEAKMGLQQMDADGRIGGEPINAQPSDGEISEQELMAILKEELNKEQPKNLPNLKPKPIARMNKGGLASTTMAAYRLGGDVAPLGYALGGDVSTKEVKTVNPKFKPLSNSYGGSNQGASKGMTSIPYENNSGDIMYFTFINGVLYPRGVVIPPNFKVMAGYQDFVPEGQKGDLTPTPETPKTDEVKIKEEGGDTDVVSDSDAWMDKFEFDGTTSQIIANASNVLKGGETGSFLSEGLSTLSPMFGLIDPVIKASNYAQVAGTVIALEESMKGDETYKPNQEDLAAYNSLKTELAAYRKANKLDRLPNEFYNGDAFARQINATQIDFALGRNAKDLDGNLVFKTGKQFNKQMQKNAPMGQVWDPTAKSYQIDESFSDEERYKGLGTTITKDGESYRSFTADETKAAQEAGVVGSQRPSKRPAFSGNSRSSNNDDSNGNDDGGFDSGPDNKPGHLYQTGGLVQRRKKKK